MSPFTQAADDCRRELHAAMPVVQLHDEIDHGARARAVFQSITFARMNLAWLKDAAGDKITLEQMRAFDHDVEQLLFLRAELRMKQTTAHLCNHFGRPAP